THHVTQSAEPAEHNTLQHNTMLHNTSSQPAGHTCMCMRIHIYCTIICTHTHTNTYTHTHTHAVPLVLSSLHTISISFRREPTVCTGHTWYVQEHTHLLIYTHTHTHTHTHCLLIPLSA